MPLSLAMAAPAAAAAASLAYLNARTSIWYDWALLTAIAPSTLQMMLRERLDRLNQFYTLEHWATSKSTAGRTFIKFEDKSYTYAQVYSIVLKYGTWLRLEQGVKPKDIVAMDFQNSDTFAFIWLGLWAIGAKPAFINYNLTGHALAHCVKAATASLMLVDLSVADRVTDEVRAQLDSVRILVLTPELEGQILSMDEVRYPNDDRSEDLHQNLAILIYTSGTTGLPKPAVVSFGKCITASGFAHRWLQQKKDDVFFTSMPLYHSSAAILGFLNTLEAGGTIAIGPKFSAHHFWNQVRESGATIIQYVGETCRYLLAAPPQIDPVSGENLDKKHKVRLAFGNGLRPDVWARFKDRFGIDAIGEFYAATEAHLGTFNMSRNGFSYGAIGRNGWIYNAIMSFSVAVVELDHDMDEVVRDAKTGRCRKVRTGTAGEMIFRLPADTARKFQGYFNNPKATEAKIMRDVFKEGDVWFRTGDMVIWDSEGRVYFTDRIGDTFRWKSENVSTAEVSHVIGLHPGVHEANVYGVELPHHDGRAGCAAVTLNGEPDEVLMRSIAEHVNKALPGYARPIFLRVMNATGQQMTGTNKQQKHHLRVEGINPANVPPSSTYWLRGEKYIPFSQRDWISISRGGIKL